MGRFKPLSDEAFANAQAAADADETPYAVDVSFDKRSHKITIELNTGAEIAFDAELAFGLADATPVELANVEVAGGGTTIAFPKLNQYFTVSRIMEGFFGPMEWGRRERRAAASRANGKKGGRPPKNPDCVPETAKVPEHAL